MSKQHLIFGTPCDRCIYTTKIWTSCFNVTFASSAQPKCRCPLRLYLSFVKETENHGQGSCNIDGLHAIGVWIGDPISSPSITVNGTTYALPPGVLTYGKRVNRENSLFY